VIDSITEIAFTVTPSSHRCNTKAEEMNKLVENNKQNKTGRTKEEI
jgi:hypothetical protein